MTNPFDFPKSKIPVPESPFLSKSRASGFLSDLSDQVFFDDPMTNITLDSLIGPSPSTLDKPPYSYGPRGLLHDRDLDEFLATTTSIVPTASILTSPGPSNRKSRRKKPPDLHIRASSALVEKKLEELLGPKVDVLLDELIVPPLALKASRSMDNLKSGDEDQDPYYSLSPGSGRRYPFSRVSERMDRKKSSSHSRLTEDPYRRPLNRESPPSDFPANRPPAPPPRKQERVNKGKTSKSDAKSSTSSSVPKNGKSEKKPPFSKSTDNVESSSKEVAGPSGSTSTSVPKSTVAGTGSKEALQTQPPTNPPTVVVTVSGSTPETVPEDKKPKPKVAGETGKKLLTDPSKGSKGQPISKRQKTSTLALKNEAPGEPVKKMSGKSTPITGSNSKLDTAGKAAGGAGSSNKGSDKKAGVAGAKDKDKDKDKDPHPVPDAKKAEGAAVVAPDAAALAGTKPEHIDKEKERADELEREKHRELIQRVLTMCQKSDWHAVEQSLRYLEKAIVLGITDDLKPLAGVADEVNQLIHTLTSIPYISFI